MTPSMGLLAKSCARKTDPPREPSPGHPFSIETPVGRDSAGQKPPRSSDSGRLGPSKLASSKISVPVARSSNHELGANWGSTPVRAAKSIGGSPARGPRSSGRIIRNLVPALKTRSWSKKVASRVRRIPRKPMLRVLSKSGALEIGLLDGTKFHATPIHARRILGNSPGDPPF